MSEFNELFEEVESPNLTGAACSGGHPDHSMTPYVCETDYFVCPFKYCWSFGPRHRRS
jgi:hypothetical protein